MTTTLVALEEAALAEVRSADARLSRAQSELQHFIRMHMAMVDGIHVYVCRPEEMTDLNRQHHVLVIEADEASRQHSKALADWAQFKAR